jgi:hypothetical protein
MSSNTWAASWSASFGGVGDGEFGCRIWCADRGVRVWQRIAHPVQDLSSFVVRFVEIRTGLGSGNVGVSKIGLRVHDTGSRAALSRRGWIVGLLALRAD